SEQLKASDMYKFDPNGSKGFELRLAKWQWIRNHLDLSALIAGANWDATKLNYRAAEEKYQTALDWTRKLREIATGSRIFWNYNPQGWSSGWNYDPATFAKQERSADVSTLEKLVAYEKSYHITFRGYDYDVGSGDDIKNSWWDYNKPRLRYLLDDLYFRY